MEIIGIIAEYNPFHNGHLYHINKIKEKYPDSIIILVLNGYFLERGEISIQKKEDKVKLALNNNIDIVVELPALFGTQSADTFASIAIKILNEFKVQKIIFGSEINDANKILELAKKQLAEGYNEKIKECLKKGVNYPTALAKSLKTDFEFTPNDLLGISYAKAILSNKYNIEIETIKRTNDYHDKDLDEEIVSASNIREKIKSKNDIAKYLPKDSKNCIVPISEDKMFDLLKYKIISENDLSQYLDVDEGLDYLLKEKILLANNIDELIQNIKSKRYTYNKLRRMLTHILLGITKDMAKDNLEYITVLGFDKKGKNYLHKIKDNINISLKKDYNSNEYLIEKKASLIYDLITKQKTIAFEIKNKPIIK